jgi:uncharacterized protein (UPF0264 family)
MLASVATQDEARAAFHSNVDILDLKDPAQGALGAVAPGIAAAVVAEFRGRLPVSATVGDLLHPEEIRAACRHLAEIGVDFVKVGIFAPARLAESLPILAAEAARGTRLVAVLFPDLGYGADPENIAGAGPIAQIGADAAIAHILESLPRLAAAGIHGAMLDTATKAGGSLRQRLPEAALAAFVRHAHGLGLFTGLAGGLRLEDVAPLLALGPDYLGFRGALCAGQERTQALDPARLARVRAAIPRLAGPPQPVASRPAMAP